MASERISVIIPVYNGERFLAEAIQSVLDQTLPPDEIIVVDDGSTDDSATIVAQMAAVAAVPIRLVRQANQGPAAARNVGLSLAVGELIAFQDADDRWLPGKLARQATLMRQHDGAQAVIGYAQLTSVQPGTTLEQPLGQPGLILLLQASLFRRSLFERVDGFDPTLRGDEDIEWFMRLLEHPIEILVQPEVVVIYYRHAANLTGNLQRSQQQLARALGRALLRRRQMQTNPQRAARLSFLPALDSGNREAAR
jgi:glycosyltransferase involved in cell wall biosynthesis